MRKRIWSAAATVVLVSGAGVLLQATGGMAADNRVAMVEGNQNDLSTYKSQPIDITVPAGSTVVWHNDGQQPHTATANDGSFASPYLTNGKEFSFTFKTPGDVQYYCEPHVSYGMKGVVHVLGASTP